ncbi:MAG: hypothetical protein JSV08_05840 [Acidobacteriota bacterium]|nr:MAG: hypothetical protein JSV08_05840 [Acidobacteriota bacterium]
MAKPVGEAGQPFDDANIRFELRLGKPAASDFRVRFWKRTRKNPLFIRHSGFVPMANLKTLYSRHLVASFRRIALFSETLALPHDRMTGSWPLIPDD